MKRNNEYLIGNQFAKGNKPNKTAFKKGFVPWNKNLKGIHLSRKTEFKKGQRSLRFCEVGTIKKRREKRKKERQFIKIENPRKWMEYAKYLWIKNYGEIIKGDIIHHINGNTVDDRIENLLALPRSHHPIFHSRWGIKDFTKEQLDYYKNRYAEKRLSQERLEI